MRTRILLAGLLTAGLLAGGSMADAASPTCRDSATREVDGSNLLHGEAFYTGTVTGTPGDGLLTPSTERSSGTVTANLFLQGTVCRDITYTLVAVYDAPPSSDLPVLSTDPEPVELSRTTRYKRSDENVTELRFTLNVPEHETECVHLYATTSTTKLLDQAPDPDSESNPPFNEICISDGGIPGSQYWN